MLNSLLLLWSACSTPETPPRAIDQASPPPGAPSLRRLWTRSEPRSTGEVAVALPGTPPRALLYQRKPNVGPGLLIVERVGDELVTSPPPLTVDSLCEAQLDDATGDGIDDLILRTMSSVRVIDPLTWTVLHELRLPSEENDVGAGAWPLQADLDPEPELLIASSFGVVHYDLDGTVVAFLPIASRPRVVQFDADPAPELYFDYPTMVLDGVTFRPEPLEIPLKGEIAPGPDVDGDGVQELLHRGQNDGQLLNLMSGATTPLRMGLVGLEWGAFMADAWHDGQPDLWVPTLYGPSWIIVDPVTGQPRDAVSAVTALQNVATVAQWDSDSDGIAEILYGGNGILGLVDTVQPDWITQHDVAVPGDLTLGDLDGDGREELIECLPGRLILRDADTAARTGQIVLPPEFDPFLYCQAGDIDGDGDSELAISNVRETWVFDVAGGVATDLYRHPGGGPTMLLRDANGDGLADLLWRNNGVCMAPSGVSSLWCAPYTSVRSMEVADLDGDGQLEVILASSSMNTVVLAGADGSVITTSATRDMAVSASRFQGRSFLASIRSVAWGPGIDFSVWELSGGVLTEVLEGSTPSASGIGGLRMDGPALWVSSGSSGLGRLDMRTGILVEDELGSGHLNQRAVFRPREVLMRVSDGWIAWRR